MNKAIIFDMDGVLINSMQYHIKSWIYAFNKFGIKPSKTDFALFEGASYKETIKLITTKYNKSLTETEKEEVYKIKKQKISEIYNQEVYPEIIPILNLLKNKKLRLSLVSGANKKFVKEIVEKFFPNTFEIIISGEDVKKGKPNPESYIKALEKLNIKSEEAIVIENAPFGIKSAKQAGIYTIAITTTLKKEYLEEADLIVNSHDELKNTLEKMINKE